MSDVPDLLRECQVLGLDLHGVSFHVGSGCTDDGAFEEPIRNAAEVFRMAREFGFSPTLLDIGGGFPGTDEVLPFEKIARSINGALDEHFPEGCGVDVIAEPGRFFAHVTSTLAVSVFAKRDIDVKTGSAAVLKVDDAADAIPGDDEFDIPDASAYAAGEEAGLKAAVEGPFRYLYYVSDGLYGSFNCVMYDHYDLVRPHLVNVPDRPDSKDRCGGDAPRYMSKVFGPTCDGLDCILPSVMLPELHVGDWLFFEEMGAYSWAAASSFNGFSPPARKYVVPDYLL
jgi:ornithine decarboxylase